MMVHWSGGNRFDRSLGWVEIEGLRSCETWVFHKSGWVFHKFTENGKFLHSVVSSRNRNNRDPCSRSIKKNVQYKLKFAELEGGGCMPTSKELFSAFWPSVKIASHQRQKTNWRICLADKKMTLKGITPFIRNICLFCQKKNITVRRHLGCLQFGLK